MTAVLPLAQGRSVASLSSSRCHGQHLTYSCCLTTKGYDHKTPIRTSFDQRFDRYSQLSNALLLCSSRAAGRASGAHGAAARSPWLQGGDGGEPGPHRGTAEAGQFPLPLCVFTSCTQRTVPRLCCPCSPTVLPLCLDCGAPSVLHSKRCALERCSKPVSYTHLTLPTKA